MAVIVPTRRLERRLLREQGHRVILGVDEVGVAQTCGPVVACALAMPPEKRPYHTVRELLEKTPGFWSNYVRPMLDFEAGGVYRYLTTAGQPNTYLLAVEANMAEVNRRLQAVSG